MITHQYKDGSEDYEYERGDEVVILDIIANDSWLRRHVGKIGIVEGMQPYNRDAPSRHTMMLDVRVSPEWGPPSCYPWMVEPTPETKEKATVLVVSQKSELTTR